MTLNRSCRQQPLANFCICQSRAYKLWRKSGGSEDLRQGGAERAIACASMPDGSCVGVRRWRGHSSGKIPKRCRVVAVESCHELYANLPCLVHRRHQMNTAPRTIETPCRSAQSEHEYSMHSAGVGQMWTRMSRQRTTEGDVGIVLQGYKPVSISFLETWHVALWSCDVNRVPGPHQFIRQAQKWLLPQGLPLMACIHTETCGPFLLISICTQKQKTWRDLQCRVASHAPQGQYA